jgi:ATP-binding cassette subfamily C protein CydC
MNDLLAILRLWRNRTSWMAAGIGLSLLALAAGLLMMALAGRLTAAAVVAGVITTPILLRLSGVFRVVLRYLERVVTHEATFRSLADLRVWFFAGVAERAAGGLGYRRSGDVLTRVVNDVESLDGLYSRILVPLAGAVLILPVLVIVLAFRSGTLAIAVAALFVVAAFVLPWFAARATAAAGERLATGVSSLRVSVLDALTGLREVRVFGAEGRMLAAMQGREATLLAAQRDVARQARIAQAVSFLCAQAAILAVLQRLPPPSSPSPASRLWAACPAPGPLPATPPPAPGACAPRPRASSWRPIRPWPPPCRATRRCASRAFASAGSPSGRRCWMA